MRKVVIEKVGVVKWYPGDEVGVSDVFGEEVEAEEVMGSVWDAAVLDFGWFAYITLFDGEVADIRGEVRSSIDNCQ